LLKKVAEDQLPAEILRRRKKGFSVPLEHWFQGDLNAYAYDWLTSTGASQRGIFRSDFVRNLLDSHRKARAANYSDAIWTLLCLEHWFRIYMDAPSSSIRPSALSAQAGS
jgi:asparagine synthase (glutamine-hydrolysing)